MTYTIDTSYSGFTLKQVDYIDEIDSTVYLFRHDTLGCPLLAIKNSDNNKTFAAAFNTIPTDSTGVAHILEHSVLMGSEKYPVKDVFGEINKGGLMTFLNAMTGSDVTYYPFATRNLKEYFNLMDVYCDVVFNPLLARSTFEQEGWHYHKEEEYAPLQYQGVVYNEMKGAFSDPIRLIFHHIFAGMMPGSTYAHESGGDPKNIPDLSYEEFVAFHKDHYHPSNAMLFVYGNADLDEELSYLQQQFLSRFASSEEPRHIEEGTLADEPVHIEDSYSVESTDTSKKTFLAVGTSVSTVVDSLQNMAFQILANILYNSDASPLKNSIVSSGLCNDFGGFYLSSMSYRTFMITYLVGSEAEHKEAFLELFNTTLTAMVTEGLDRELILSELNKYEFSFREEMSKAQRGLDLIGKAMVAFKYDTDPFDILVSEEALRTIRHKALNEGYFEELIKKYLLENPSTVVVTLTPDPDKLAATQAEEQERLRSYAATLTPEDEEQLIGRTNELMTMQLAPNSVDTLSKLPQLTTSDLSTDISFHAATPTEIAGQTVLVSDLPTNHITYLDTGFDFSCVPASHLPYLDLFGTIVTEIGTQKMDFIRFAKETATCTGGFSHSLNTYTRRGQTDTPLPMLWFNTRFLPEYQEKSLALLADVFGNFSFQDRARIKEIVTREFTWAEHAAHSEGYSLAATRVFAHLGPAGVYNEMVNGFTSYFALKTLAKNYDAMEESFLTILEELGQLLFRRNNMHLAITAGQDELTTFSSAASCLTTALPDRSVDRVALPPLSLAHHEAFINSAEVVYAVQGGTLLHDTNAYNGHFEVLKTYLSRDYLWNSVRQMGGAYGCFIQFSQISGNLALVSYRDPQVKKTYDAYNQIPEVVADLDIPAEVLEQLIIGTFGNFDPHQSPAAKGATAKNEYFSGITPEYKLNRLQEITSTRVEDLRLFAPAFDQLMTCSHRTIIGNRTKIEADRELFDTLTEI